MFIPDESVIQTLAKISNISVSCDPRTIGIELSWLTNIFFKLIDGKWQVEQNNEVLEKNQLQIWNYTGQEPCRGHFRRNTCIISLKDLPTYLRTNKFIGVFSKVK